MAFLDHYKNRRLVSAPLVVLACFCVLTPADLAAQNVGNQQIQSMVQGASPQEIMERLRQSGLSRVEVQDQLRRAGYSPNMADAYFDMMEGTGEAPTGGAGEVLTALENVGVLLRTVESPFEDVTCGVINAIIELEELSGRKILDNDKIISPQSNNIGVYC